MTASVCKLGGRAFEEPGASARFAAEVAACVSPLILVHGGGIEVTAWCERLGIEPRFSDGLRVTDSATLDVVAAVLAGLANKRLVAALRHAGVDAVGLAALDGGVVAVAPHARAGELGEVGEVRSVRPALLRELLASGRTPVVSSLGAHEGRLLNLNADDVAGALAGSLRAPALLLLGDAAAVVLDGVPRARIAPGDLATVLAHPDVKDGMRPKLRAAQAAIGGGARRVVIGRYGDGRSLADLLSGNGGTLVCAEETANV